MDKNKSLILAALGAFCLSSSVFSQMANPVLDGQMERARGAVSENTKRVAELLKAKNKPANSLTWFSVPACSDRMRLFDTFPVDGRHEGEIRIVVAQDEFEPASFQLFSFNGLDKVDLKVSPLKNEKGAVIAAENVDLRVVKLWLQNGNGWQSYFADVGLMLVPELALHDENMVKVDLQKQANYARVKGKDGKDNWVWISQPKEIATSFDALNENFMDTETLQPVALDANSFKQFLLTVHAPKGQTPGVYSGTISVSKGGKELLSIPVKTRVLPFVLPEPRPYNDLDGNYIVSFMGGTSLSALREKMENPDEAKAFYTKYLKSMRDHGISHPCVNQNKENYDLLRSLGMPTKPVMMGNSFLPWFALNFGGRMTFEQMQTAREAAELSSKFYNDLVGHNDVLVSYGDEQGAAFVTAHRPFYRFFTEKGMKVGTAGHEALLWKGGYAQDVYPMGGKPNDVERIRPWAEIGGKYLGFYASQHNASENPQFVRMQHGLLGYLSGLNMVFNYEFALGPWNDLDCILYRPMVVSYMNKGGLVETLAFSGFREGIDDIRYATYLKQLVREAEEKGNIDAYLQGKKALQFLALLPRDKMDLNMVRSELVEHILKLRKALNK